MALPEQIQKQAEAIAKHYENQNAEAATTEQSEIPAGHMDVDAEQADRAKEIAAESPLNEQERLDPKVEETFEKRYKTLQGMYNADTARLRSENQQLNGRVTQLEQLLSTLSTQSTPRQEPAAKLITDKDMEEYGDSIDVMRRVTAEALSDRDQRVAELEQMVRQMQTSVLPRVEQVAHKQAVSAEQLFWTELSAAVPDWKETNANSDFQSWLLEVDPLTGLSRQTYLEDAQRNLDARRVANFFSAWQNKGGQSVAQPSRNAAVSELDKQVAPGRGRSSGAPAGNNAKTYTSNDIKKFFDDVRKGVYRGREAERDRIERDIFAAQQENRIVATG
jgi:uncharacterized protein YeaO (DUF488 family)